jgi:hypothetical protein
VQLLVDNPGTGHSIKRTRTDDTLSLAILVYLMYLWSGETTVKSASDTTGVSQKTIVQLYQYMRDVCSTKFWTLTKDELPSIAICCIFGGSFP